MATKLVKRPDSVRVAGRDYSIDYVLPHPLGTEATGICDNMAQKIVCLEGLTPLEEGDTVLHEVIHAVDFVAGLDLQERQVRHLATILLGVLQDNPQFATWLAQPKNVKQPRNRKGTR